MKKITLEEAIKILVSTIVNNITHRDYDRVTKRAKLYKQLITGEDIDELLIQFNPREELAMFEQRKRLTKIITPAVASAIMKPFYKVPRTDRLVKKITPTKDDNKASVEEIQLKMDQYFGSEANIEGLDYFLQNRFIELMFTDPNAFIVTEFEAFDNATTKASPYPFEVDSYQAVRFKYINNELIWLIVKEDICFEEDELKNKRATGKTIKKDGYRWSMYTDNDTIVFEQVKEGYTLSEEEEAAGSSVQKLPTGTYVVSVFAHKTGKVPATRVGYKRDLSTKGRTFLNPFDDAICFFEKSIKTVSEFDITNALHTFQQKIQYAPKCVGESDVNGCRNGTAAMGGVCTVCKGTAVMPFHTSAQDALVLPLPDDPSQMMDLNKLMVYMSPDIQLLEFQNKLILQTREDCFQTVFNQTALVKTSTVATATEKNIDQDSIYDTLAPFAEKYSAIWLHIGDMIVRQTDNEGKVELLHRFAGDLKLKTRNELYGEMKLANDSYAPTFLIESLNDDIAGIVFQDEPDELLMYTVKKRLQPFRGKENEIARIIATDYTPKWKKVLYDNFEDIISSAVREDKDFYVKDYDKQLEAVKKLTDDILAEIDAATPKPTFKPIAE